MTLRILGGRYKGHSIHLPSFLSVRPTTVLLRRKIFDAYQNIEDYVFIDLCCGSGLMAFEAWSRGALEVVGIENNKKVFECLQKQVQDLTVHEIKNGESLGKMTVLFMKGQSYLNTILQNELFKNKKLIFYVDPPYQDLPFYQKVFELYEKYQKEESYSGMFWIEGDESVITQKEMEKKIGFPLKIYTQQKHFIAVYRF